MAKPTIHQAAPVSGPSPTTCGFVGRKGTKPMLAAGDGDVTCKLCLEAMGARVVEVKSKGGLDERSVYVSMTQTRVGIRRRIEVEDITGEAEGDDGDADDADMIHVAKDIIDARELRAVRKSQRAAYRWLRRWGYPTRIRPGIYRLPLSFVVPMVKQFEFQQVETNKHVEAFIAQYDGIKAKAKARLGKLYDEADYPSADILRGAFRLSFCFMGVGVPGTLSVISQEVYRAEAEKATARVHDEEQLIIATLRAQVAKTVNHMVSILQPGTDNRAKRFSPESVESAREFFDLFGEKSIVPDEQLAGLVARAKLLLDGVDAAQLKGSADLRDEVRVGFEKVRAELTTMVSLKSSRAVKL